MHYVIVKLQPSGPEKWWTGEKFSVREDEVKVFDSCPVAEAELELAQSHSYVLVEIQKYERPNYI